MQELINQRNLTRKVFDLGNGQKLYRFHIAHQHYIDSGSILQDIDTTLLSKVGGLYLDKAAYQCEIPDLATGDFIFFNKDHNFNLRLSGVSGIQRISKDRNSVQYPNLFGNGIHYEVYAANHGVRHLIRFDKSPSDVTKDFVVTYEILTLPEVIEFSGANNPKVFSAFTLGNILDNKAIRMRKSIGITYSYMMFPTVWDATGRTLPVSLRIYKSGNKFYLQKIIPKAIFQNAVYPIYADHPTAYYSGAGDGRISNEADLTTWNTIHDGGTGTSVSYTDVISFVWSYVNTGTYFAITRGFIPIDTSGIDDAANILSAMLYLFCYEFTDGDNDASAYINIGQTSQPNHTILAVADFDALTIDAPPLGCDTNVDITNINIAAYTTFALNATGLGWISKTNHSLFGLREGHDIDDHPIASNTLSRVRWYPSEDTNGSRDPYIDVTVANPPLITATETLSFAETLD